MAAGGIWGCHQLPQVLQTLLELPKMIPPRVRLPELDTWLLEFSSSPSQADFCAPAAVEEEQTGPCKLPNHLGSNWELRLPAQQKLPGPGFLLCTWSRSRFGWSGVSLECGERELREFTALSCFHFLFCRAFGALGAFFLVLLAPSHG